MSAPGKNAVRREREMQQRKEKAEKLFCAANSAASLLLGACVYACFNQDSYFGEWMCMLFPGLRRIGLREGRL